MNPESPLRSARVRPQKLLTVYDAGSQQILGRLVDLSITGLMLITSEPLAVDREFQLEIRATTDQKTAGLSLNAVSAWCRNNPNNLSHYGVGFRFNKISTDTVTLLEKLMHESG